MSRWQMLDPDKVFQALEDAAEIWVEAQAQHDDLERKGEILLSQLVVEARASGEPATTAKDKARSSEQWKTHCTALTETSRAKNSARAKYDNLKTLAELRRSQEATARYMTR